MKNLIISICGDESMHKTWQQGGEDFDLFVIYYGESGNKYQDDGDLYDQAKGTKFVILSQMLEKHASFLKRYDAICIPDDDLYITGKDWDRFFKLFHKYDMILAQPSIMGWQCMHTSAHHPSYILRYTNWVEIMTPCFNQESFQKLKHTFDENETNWGIDFLWIKELGEPEKGVGIIDDVVAIHTRPCFFGDTYYRNKNNSHKAFSEILELGEKHKINLHDIVTHGGVERSKLEYDNRASEDKFFPSCEIMKELITSLRKKRCRNFI